MIVFDWCLIKHHGDVLKWKNITSGWRIVWAACSWPGSSQLFEGDMASCIHIDYHKLLYFLIQRQNVIV